MLNKKFLFFAMLALVLGTTPFAVHQTAAARTMTNVDDHHDGDHHDGDDDDDDDDDNHGAQLLVDNDKVQCPNAQFTSIQAAVTAAPAGAVIKVCPGTYPETVRISKSLTVRGIRVGNQNLILINPPIAAANTTSLATGNPLAAIVLVDRNATVTLDDLTVDGANNLIGGCAPNLAGIFYRNASGKIKNSAVRNIRLFPDAQLGCQSGFGILAQSGNEVNVRRGARLEVANTSVHDYQKNGITGNESGTELIATGNAVTGLGPNNQIAQNGIQIGFGARGSAEDNSVINNNYSACTSVVCNFTASNILIFTGTSGVKVLRNNLGKSQINIFFGSDTALTPLTNGLIEGNTILDSDVFGDGIYINGNNNTARYNTIFNSDEASVFIDGNNNRITDNTFNEAPIGVLVNTGSGNQISGNHYYNIAQRVSPASAANGPSFNAPQQTVAAGTKVSPARP
jgi:hypothetical protein